MESRREFLLTTGALALTGCATPCPPLAAPGEAAPTTALIDGHCHLFNVSDLSAVRFLSYVVLKHYPPLECPVGPERFSPPQDPDWADALMGAVLGLVGAQTAPTAETELGLLEGGLTFAPAPEDPAVMREFVIRRAAELLGGKTFSKENAEGEGRLRRLIAHAGGARLELVPLFLERSTLAERTNIARRAFSRTESLSLQSSEELRAQPDLGSLYLPGLIDFIVQLKRYRHCLADQLTQIHREAGQNPTLLAPAMVDFGRWLRQEPERGSSFTAQSRVWRRISRRPGGPAVHGYVAFCPLRQVEFERGLFGPDADNPMEVVKTALTEYGFLGVKLYPPMGFRASNNAARGPKDHPLPVAVLKDVFGDQVFTEALWESRTAELGGLLDEALFKFFDYCAGLGAPVMAHGGNSVAANCQTGELADPYYWGPVFERHRGLRVMLAHFGGFRYRSADPSAPGQIPPPADGCATDTRQVPFDNTWEAWLVRYMAANPDAPVFSDLSYFSEALGPAEFQQALYNFRKFDARQLELLRQRLVFGTDWVMLAQEKNVSNYSGLVRQFAADLFNPDGARPDHVDDVMRRNFLSYAGLVPDSETFKRIARVYDGDAALTARLAAACTT